MKRPFQVKQPLSRTQSAPIKTIPLSMPIVSAPGELRTLSLWSYYIFCGWVLLELFTFCLSEIWMCFIKWSFDKWGTLVLGLCDDKCFAYLLKYAPSLFSHILLWTLSTFHEGGKCSVYYFVLIVIGRPIQRLYLWFHSGSYYGTVKTLYVCHDGFTFSYQWSHQIMQIDYKI